MIVYTGNEVTIVAIRANGQTIRDEISGPDAAEFWLEKQQRSLNGYSPIQVAYLSDGTSLKQLAVPLPGLTSI